MNTTAKKTSTALIVPGVGLDLTQLQGKGSDIAYKAEQALNAIAVRSVIIDTEAEREKEEMKKLQLKLAASPVGIRMNEIKKNAAARKAEKNEINAGTKHLLKFFKDNNIRVNQTKIKAGK